MPERLDFSRGSELYRNLIVAVVSNHISWKISSACALVPGGVGRVDAVKAVVETLKLHVTAFSIAEINNDISAEIVRREEGMKADITNACIQKVSPVIAAAAGVIADVKIHSDKVKEQRLRDASREAKEYELRMIGDYDD